jgi:anti-sigma28 factor (negative regulator of flagellin synthesis)
MNSVNGVGGTNPINQVTSQPVRKSVPTDAAPQDRASDRVELSGMSSLMASLKQNNIRTDKVADIKSQIASGTYEDDHKLSVAADRLLDDLNG